MIGYLLVRFRFTDRREYELDVGSGVLILFYEYDDGGFIERERARLGCYNL
jgi:hypothetical protein